MIFQNNVVALHRYLNNVGACMCDNSECTSLSQFFRARVLLFTPWMPCSGYLERKLLERAFEILYMGACFSVISVQLMNM